MQEVGGTNTQSYWWFLGTNSRTPSHFSRDPSPYYCMNKIRKFIQLWQKGIERYFKSLNYNLFFTSAIFCTFELLLFGPTLTLKNKNCLKNTQLDHLGHCQAYWFFKLLNILNLGQTHSEICLILLLALQTLKCLGYDGKVGKIWLIFF